MNGLHYPPAPLDAAVAELAADYPPVLPPVATEASAGADPARVECRNPATGELLTRVQLVSGARLDAPLLGVHPWGALSDTQRAWQLVQWQRSLVAAADRLAVVQTLQSGLPVRRSREVVDQACDLLLSYAGWADKLEYAGLPAGGSAGTVLFAPTGAAGMLDLLRVLGPALACGAGVVLAPTAASAPLALVLAQLAPAGGLAAGTVGVVVCAPQERARLAANPEVRLLVTTDPHLQPADAGAASTRVLREPARPGTLVVHADAAIDQVVEVLVEALIDASASPLGAPRLLVAEPIVADLLGRLDQQLGRLRTGDPLDRNTDLGPVPDEPRRQDLTALVQQAVAEGATKHTSGQGRSQPWLTPTVLTGLGPTQAVLHRCLNGPVLPVLTFRTPDEAVAVADSVGVGAFAAVWGQGGARAQWTAEHLAALGADEVVVNGPYRSDPRRPFGGAIRPGLDVWGVCGD